MRRILGLVLICAASACVRAQAPHVIDSIPRNGDLQVDPGLGWMVFLFDRDMTVTDYSVCANGPTAPKFLSTRTWLNSRVFMVQIQLEPNHDYQFSLNCSAFHGFCDVSGNLLEPYPVAFRTKGGAPPLTPALNSEAVDELRRVIDEEYSYRDLRGVDWPSLFRQYSPALIQAKTVAQFAETAATLLANAKDLHITLVADGKTIGTFNPQLHVNINVALLPQIIPDFRQPSSAVCTGRFPDGIRYVLIGTWAQESDTALEAIYPVLWEAADGPGLIIDVRPNTGGAETLAQQVAGCFIEESCVYAKDMLRSSTAEGGFTPPIEKTLQPNEGRPRYRGPIVVLMGQGNVSSCERFLLMMKQAPGCTLLGEKSYGASGDPHPHELGNGVTVRVPSWKALQPDGTLIEGQGIEPDVEILATTEQFAAADPVLQAALTLLRSNER
jgi:hypothetical protein